MPLVATSQPRSFAFFDVDDTLIATKSMLDFYRYWCLVECDNAEELTRFERSFERLRALNESREGLNRAYYAFFAGLTPQKLVQLGRRWFAHAKAARPELINKPVIEALRRHAAAGVAPVFVSGSCEALLRPLADECGVQYILSAPLLLDERGAYSGALGEPQTIGEGKGRALRAFLAAHGGDARACFAYGDDISDLPMLESVGTQVVVGAAGPLVDIARTRGWERIVLPSAHFAPAA